MIWWTTAYAMLKHGGLGALVVMRERGCPAWMLSDTFAWWNRGEEWRGKVLGHEHAFRGEDAADVWRFMDETMLVSEMSSAIDECEALGGHWH